MESDGSTLITNRKEKELIQLRSHTGSEKRNYLLWDGLFWLGD